MVRGYGKGRFANDRQRKAVMAKLSGRNWRSVRLIDIGVKKGNNNIDNASAVIYYKKGATGTIGLSGTMITKPIDMSGTKTKDIFMEDAKVGNIFFDFGEAKNISLVGTSARNIDLGGAKIKDMRVFGLVTQDKNVNYLLRKFEESERVSFSGNPENRCTFTNFVRWLLSEKRKKYSS